MHRRLMGLVVLAASMLLLATVFWELPYSRTIQILSALIVAAFGFYEAVRPSQKDTTRPLDD